MAMTGSPSLFRNPQSSCFRAQLGRYAVHGGYSECVRGVWRRWHLEMLTTTVKIADLLFYLVVVHSPLYNEYGHDFITTFICASILYTAHEKTNFPRYMKGQARAHEALHRQQNKSDQK